MPEVARSVIYKYVPFERKDILENGVIRFTQPGAFNDPFEMHPSFDLMSKADMAALPDAPDRPGMKLLTPEALGAMFSALREGLRRETGRTVKGPGYWSLNNNLVARSSLAAEYGVLSLTTSPNNLLMWAHYADRHRGFIVGFNEPLLLSAMPLDTQVGAVQYTENRPVLSYSTLHSTSVLFRKSPEWTYEQEWRIVRPLKQSRHRIDHPDYPIHLFELPLASISMIILGACMTEENQAAIREVCSRPPLQHLTIHNAVLNRIHFALDFHPPLDGKEPGTAITGEICEAR